MAHLQCEESPGMLSFPLLRLLLFSLCCTVLMPVRRRIACRAQGETRLSCSSLVTYLAHTKHIVIAHTVQFAFILLVEQSHINKT
jgi:hypothetical protein